MPKSKVARRALPSKERLDELFLYDPEAGRLYNKVSRIHAPAGKEAGTISGGYKVANVDGASYKVHHLIWKMAYGTDPDRHLKHLDYDKLNNRLDNLALPNEVPEPRKDSKSKELPSQALLRELFDYNSETGELICKVRTGARSVVGKAVGGYDDRGYLTTGLNGVRYKLHRLIWKWMTGEDAGSDLDHVNGDRGDNSWSNLRKVCHHVNGKNRKMARNNTSGMSGVNFDVTSGKWVARAGDNMKRKHLGRFDTFEEAVEARRKAEEELGYHENHGRLENPAA
jgi:hypothetical protein